METIIQGPVRLTSANEEFCEKDFQFKPKTLLKADGVLDNSCGECCYKVFCCAFCLGLILCKSG